MDQMAIEWSCHKNDCDFSQLSEEMEFKYDETEQSNEIYVIKNDQRCYKRSACYNKRYQGGNFILIFMIKFFLKSILLFS